MNLKRVFTSWGLIIVLLGFSHVSFAQGDPTDSLPNDPGAIRTFIVQNLKFGAFTQGGSGGTVRIETNGSRSVTGSIIGLNLGQVYFQAIIDIESAPGSLISITNGPDVVLSGSNGGTITLHIGVSDPASPFGTNTMPPGRTPVNIGGIITVGNPAASPPGVYSGTFIVTFNQE